MKTISLWQPYASLIFLDLKPDETRSWDTKYRGNLTIHAAKKIIPRDSFIEILLDSLSYEQMYYIMSKIDEAYGKYENLPTGTVLGTVNLFNTTCTCENCRHPITEIEKALGDYSENRFAWNLKDIKPFDKPIPAKGQQGFWDWNEVQHE